MSTATSNAERSNATIEAPRETAVATAHPNSEMRAAYLRALATAPAPAWPRRTSGNNCADIS
jgi:hypothetical protein